MRGFLFFAMLLACLPLQASADDVRALAPGVWRIAGANEAIGPANRGAIVNTGVVATGEGVIVIDPGSSRQRAEVIAGMVKTLTDEPIRWIIDTHAHPENVLGNSGFPDATVIASVPAAALMKNRCSLCLQRMTEQLGAPVMTGTSIRLPSKTVENGDVLMLGRRQLRFMVFARAHTQGDLAVILQEAGIVFAGGLINDSRVPDLREAELSGWIDAVTALEKLALPIVVPGHGSATDAGVPKRFSAYLTDLRAACDRDIAQRGDAASSGTRLTLPAYRQWVEYAVQHPLNVAHAYREREDAELMDKR